MFDVAKNQQIVDLIIQLKVWFFFILSSFFFFLLFTFFSFLFLFYSFVGVWEERM